MTMEVSCTMENTSFLRTGKRQLIAVAIAADNAAVSHFGISGRFYITTGEFILLMVVFKRVPLPLHYALGLSGSINTTSVCAEGDRRGEA